MRNIPHISQIKQIIRKYLPSENVRAFIFGSRAYGKSRKWSDIDVGILAGKKIPSSLMVRIEEDLENSRIPYRVEVVDFKNVSKDFRDLALRHTIPL